MISSTMGHPLRMAPGRLAHAGPVPACLGRRDGNERLEARPGGPFPQISPVMAGKGPVGNPGDRCSAGSAQLSPRRADPAEVQLVPSGTAPRLIPRSILSPAALPTVAPARLAGDRLTLSWQ